MHVLMFFLITFSLSGVLLSTFASGLICDITSSVKPRPQQDWMYHYAVRGPPESTIITAYLIVSLRVCDVLSLTAL